MSHKATHSHARRRLKRPKNKLKKQQRRAKNALKRQGTSQNKRNERRVKKGRPTK